MAPLKPQLLEQSGGEPTRRKRPVWIRLLGISVWGWVKLVGLSVLVGVLVIAGQYDPRDPTVDMLAALGSFLTGLLQALRWALFNFWQPALAGATIVFPVWFLWRLFTLPFRK